jgi:hypothetical protein
MVRELATLASRPDASTAPKVRKMRIYGLQYGSIEFSGALQVGDFRDLFQLCVDPRRRDFNVDPTQRRPVEFCLPGFRQV